MNKQLNINYGQTSRINNMCNIVAESIMNLNSIVTPKIESELNINMDDINNVRANLRKMSQGPPIGELRRDICELLYKAGRFFHLIITNDKTNSSKLTKFSDVRNDIAIVITGESASYNQGWVKEVRF